MCRVAFYRWICIWIGCLCDLTLSISSGCCNPTKPIHICTGCDCKPLYSQPIHNKPIYKRQRIHERRSITISIIATRPNYSIHSSFKWHLFKPITIAAISATAAIELRRTTNDWIASHGSTIRLHNGRSNCTKCFETRNNRGRTNSSCLLLSITSQPNIPTSASIP